MASFVFSRLAAGLLLAVLSAVVQAQSRLDNATSEQLVEALKPALPDNVPPPRLTRGLSTHSVKLPDASTNVCNAPGNVLPSSAGGGSAGTRNLYVADAPKVDLNIKFALDSARLTADGEQVLDSLGRALKSETLAKSQFVVAGHTDKLGADDYNKRLSCERALAVREYLVKKHGIDRNRLIALGFGFDRLLEAGDPAAEVNRRVEIRKF